MTRADRRAFVRASELWDAEAREERPYQARWPIPAPGGDAR